MRKTIIAILVLIFIVGCGVSKEEHKRIVNELEKAKEEISHFNGKIKKLKIDVERLSGELKKKTSLKWEYKNALISLDNLEEELNKYGKEGWEMLLGFSMIGGRVIDGKACYLFIFKRPLN